LTSTPKGYLLKVSSIRVKKLEPLVELKNAFLMFNPSKKIMNSFSKNPTSFKTPKTQDCD
jgi:hypothetical protein